MIQIMLVDDDAFFHSMFANLIEWSDFGCELAYHAYDGQKAIDILNTFDVDLLFTDMSMPAVNGVELIQYVSEFYPDVKCVALSSYDDFNYVKESLTGGAMDYILKHMLTRESIENIIKKYAHKHKRKNLGYDEISKMHISRDDFLLKMINGEYTSQKDIQYVLKALSLPEFKENIFLFALEIKGFQQVKEKYTRMNRFSQLMQTIMSIMQSILDRLGEGVVFIRRKSCRIYALLTNQQFSQLQFAGYVSGQYIQQVEQSLKLYLNIQCKLHVAPLCRNVCDLGSSYKYLLQLFNEQPKLSGSKQKTKAHFPEINVPEIRHALLLSSDNVLRNLIVDYYNEGRRQFFTNEDFAVLTEKLYKTYLTLSEEMEPDKWKKNHDENSIEIILRKVTDIELQEYILKKFQLLHQTQRNILRQKYSAVVYDALAMIYDEYKNFSLSLSTIAAEIHVNPSYLSRIFKIEIGMGVVDFINQYRIKRSIDLLSQDNMTCREIALSCGFENYNYFFKVFKRYTGTTPKEFNVCFASS